MESVNACLDLQEHDVKSFAKKGTGDKTAINPANAIVLTMCVIQPMDAYADQDIKVNRHLALFNSLRFI